MAGFMDMLGKKTETESGSSYQKSVIREIARKLAELLRGRPAHVNLIPLNHVTESGLRTSSKEHVAAFQNILEKNGVTATVRRTLGPDIDASCGQLRRRHIGETFGKE